MLLRRVWAGAAGRDALPDAAAFVAYLESELEVPITIISTGPERESLLVDRAAAKGSVLEA